MIIVLSSPVDGLDAVVEGIRTKEEASIAEVDVTDMRAVRGAVQERAPKAVVLAAWRDAAGAEEDADLAFRVSSEAAINLAAAALEFGCVPVFLSVADVFAQGGGPFSAEDVPQPATALAEAALRGETFLTRASRGRGLIVRSGPWIESIEAEVRRGEGAPSGSVVSPIRAYDLGATLTAWLARTGVVHAASSVWAPIEEVYAEAASRAQCPLHRAERPLAPRPVLLPTEPELPLWRAVAPASADPLPQASPDVVLQLVRLAPGEGWPIPGPGTICVAEGKVLAEAHDDAVVREGDSLSVSEGVVRGVLASRVVFARQGSG